MNGRRRITTAMNLVNRLWPVDEPGRALGSALVAAAALHLVAVFLAGRIWPTVWTAPAYGIEAQDSGGAGAADDLVAALGAEGEDTFAGMPEAADLPPALPPPPPQPVAASTDPLAAAPPEDAPTGETLEPAGVAVLKPPVPRPVRSSRAPAVAIGPRPPVKTAGTTPGAGERNAAPTRVGTSPGSGRSGRLTGGGNGAATVRTQQPTYLRNDPPPYPPAARQTGRQGVVLLWVSIDPRGTVAELRLRRSSGSPDLDQAAERTVRGWRFRPAMRGDAPVPSSINVPVRFQLH